MFISPLNRVIAKSMPYKLLMTPRSPFARRIRVALLRNSIPFQDHHSDVFNPTEEFFAESPLGLVPVLIEPGQPPIPDSNTILEILNERHGRIWPTDPDLRLRVRISATYAAGIMHAMVSYFLESKRDTPSQEWLTEHKDAITRALTETSKRLASGDGAYLIGAELSQAGFDVAVALEYLDFRLSEIGWRERWPNLIPVLQQAKRDPYFSQTSPIQN